MVTRRELQARVMCMSDRALRAESLLTDYEIALRWCGWDGEGDPLAWGAWADLCRGDKRKRDLVITPQDAERLTALRARIREHIDIAVEQGAGTKSREGQIVVYLPDHYEDNSAEAYAICLTLYVFGPSRRYTWSDNSFTNALDRMEQDVNTWIVELLSRADEDA